MNRDVKRGVSRGVAAWLAAVLLVTAAACSSVADGETISYVITAGTADRMAAGETVDILPAAMTMHVGDTIEIVNEDSRDHVVGVFFVARGETLRQKFTTAGVLEGECSVHPSGQFRLVVEE